MNKQTVKKILLILWCITCTAGFIYMFVMFSINISHAVNGLNSLMGDPELEQLFISDMKQTIIQCSIYLVIVTVIYVSFVSIIIPKLIECFNRSCIKNGINEPR